LTDILKKDDVKNRHDPLVRLATEVGASTTRMAMNYDSQGRQTSPYPYNAITETEIVDNIHKALQTASTISLCKTASRNFWIAIVAALIALLSALAAWAGVIFSYIQNRNSP